MNNGIFTLRRGAGLVIVAFVLLTGFILYNRHVKPVLTEAQEQVEKYFTFQITCVVQEPVKAVYQPWEDNAWVYEFPCVLPKGEEVVEVSNGVRNLYPLPLPGLHFITVADSAPVSVFHWTHYYEVILGLNLDDPPNARLSQDLHSFDFYGMDVFELWLKEEFSSLTLSFICHEELDEETLMVSYVCNSD